MKKRLFAGALALLMIIGLLPVSSMLKKPIEAQAAQRTYSYKITSDDTSTTFAANTTTKIGTDNFFTFFNESTSDVGCNSSVTVDKVKHYGMKLSKNTSQGIKFRVASEKAKVTVVCPLNINDKKTAAVVLAKTGDSNTVKKSFANTSGSKVSVLQTFVFEIEGSGDYSLYRGGDSTVFIESIEVTEDPYTITVNDEKAADDSQSVSTFYKDGDTVSLSAATEENFLYWKTSSGRIISRSPKATLTAYYDETYTAVYGSDITVYYMTEYGHVYKRIAAKDFNEDAVPDVPIRYGYKVTGWEKDVDTIKAAIAEGTKAIYVDPVYSEDTATTYKITVDKTAVGGSIADPVEKAINSVYTVSTDSSQFKCWKDADTNEVLSYNSTYSFFVNKDINIVAEAGTATPEGVISLVLKDDGKADNKDSVVVFEYTVPAGSTVTFAGVYASPDQNKLTKDDASYVDGGSFSSDQTYKYTITKRKGMATWYVKAVLEYTDSTGTHTITSEPVEF